jgi:Zn-dependent protease with chaperone function
MIGRRGHSQSAGPGDIQGWFGVLFFYALTLLLELPSAFFRLMLIGVPLSVAAEINGHNDVSPKAYVAIGLFTLFPLAFAASALIHPAGTAAYWRAQSGGRRPSERERLAYEDAVAQLTDRFPDLPLPKDWFVIDQLDTNAMVYGNSLAIHRGLFESDYLAAVIAHELGHLNTTDGKLTVALNRLLIWHRKPQTDEQPASSTSMQFGFLRLIRWAACGGQSLGILKGVWGTYWREREYDADAYAAKLGEGDSLAEFLEIAAWPYDRPIPFTWLSDESHPSTELRLERLWQRADAIAA